MTRRFWTALILLLSLSLALPAAAQKNPFADEEESEEKQDTKKDASKKDDKKKKTDKKDKKKKADEDDKDGEEPEEPAAEAEEESVDPEQAAAEAAAAEAEAARAAEAAAAEEEARRLLEDEEEEEEEEEPELSGGRVGLSQNFGRAELITTAIALPLGLGIAIGGPTLFGEPNASMTSPRLGSLDYRLSIASHGDLLEGSPFAFGIFDVAGIAYPAALGTFYLISGVYLWAADAPMLGGQSVNIDHSMIAMAQNVGWTALAAGGIHLLIGRQKPYAAFRRTGYGEPDASGTNLSFISTTTALSFAMSAFAARDYADWALRNDQNIVTGAILPYALLYGLSAMIGYSAIYGQQHYFSDIAVSALLGALIGNLTYVAHFESDGTPRAKRQRGGRSSVGPTLLTHPDEKTTVGVGLSGRF